MHFTSRIPSRQRPSSRRAYGLAGTLVLSLVLLGASTNAACAQDDRSGALPNVVIVLADDLGYGSVGCYGAPPELVRTPHIDQLAREGMRFTDGNTASSVCTPTRYALLTGRYCWRSPLELGVANVLDPLLIETDRPTIASLLEPLGYRSAAIGKWHLGYGLDRRVDYTGELKPGPLELGFDYHFAVPQNNGDMTGVYVENHRVVGLRSDRLDPNPGKTFYGSTYLGLDAPQRDDNENMPVLTDKALAWLQTVPADTPFFLYFAATAVHEPITPSPEVQGTSEAGPYGDFLHDVDRTVGLLMGAVARRGDTENTLFLFTSDNGGVLPRVDQQVDRNPSTTQAVNAGLKINGDWRGRKHSIYQGGFRVPFVVRWPDRVEAGSVCDAMVNVVDIFATVAEMVGRPLPDTGPREGAEDSVSFLGLLTGEDADAGRRDMISHSAVGNFAIRQGPWKYIEGKAHPKAKPGAVKGRAEEHVPQLYNLVEDPAEQVNRIDELPETAARLAKRLDAVRAGTE